MSLDRELGRFVDEHASMHIHPNAKTNRVIRSLAQQHKLIVFSVMPTHVANSVLQHLGLKRSIDTVVGEVIAETVQQALYAQHEVTAEIATKNCSNRSYLSPRSSCTSVSSCAGSRIAITRSPHCRIVSPTAICDWLSRVTEISRVFSGIFYVFNSLTNNRRLFCNIKLDDL